MNGSLNPTRTPGIHIQASEATMTMIITSRLARAVLAASALVLGGCANFSADGGFGEVRQITKQHTGLDAGWHKTPAESGAAQQRVAELLAKTLSVDDAVQVALLNNRGLQASYAELGISEADLVQVSRLPNPGFSFGRMKRGAEVEIDRGFHFNLALAGRAPGVRHRDPAFRAGPWPGRTRNALAGLSDPQGLVPGRGSGGVFALHAGGAQGR